MKVLSLVPSWTETLILAGVNVIGRTRYCIHPEHSVSLIPAVGGTKRLDLAKIKALSPDLIILDKEENTLEMAQELTDAGFQWLATHVTSIASCVEGLRLLALRLNNSLLIRWADEYEKKSLARVDDAVIQGDMKGFNGVANYVIWKDPFMIVSEDTFIGSVLEKIGLPLSAATKKYAEISEDDLKKTFCLFSSEPFPFLNQFEKLKSQGFNGAIVDGEKISWFGIRNLRFLKQDPEFL